MYLPFGRLLPVDSSAPSNGIPDIEYTANMGLTHADFFRLLPSAMGDHPYRIEGNTVIGTIHDGTVEIQLGAQQERRIALMVIPFADVSFRFRGVTEQQQQAFKSYFDLRFQRGGG